MSASTTELRRDAEVIGWVGFAHLLSHFFQLILAPLFPLIKDEFGVDRLFLSHLCEHFHDSLV